MREGMKNDGFVFAEDGSVSGLMLTADFCAEHEWGISGIKRSLGINANPEKVMGMKRHLITAGDNILHFEFKKNKTPMAILTTWRVQDWERNELTEVQYIKKHFGHYVSSWRTEKNKWSGDDFQACAGAWSERKFIFLATGRDNVEKLRIVHEAFQKNDIAVFGGGRSGPFTNSGLCIAIYSKMPKDLLDQWTQEHKSQARLEKAAKKTKIEKILEKAGCRYYALSPRWKDETEKEVVFWLNPMDQERNEHGWYGVEELKQWAKGEGPIPTKQKRKEA